MMLAQQGVDFVDAPVSGGVEGAKQGELAIMAGGEVAAIEKLTPVFDAIGSKVTHMGPVGSGQATKAVNQVMAAGINQAVTEALAFAKAQNLPMEKVIEVISGGAAGNWFLQHRGPTMVEDMFEPGFKVHLHHKDLTICKSIAEQLGVALPVVEMTLVHYWRLMNAGFGEEDISALYREKQRLFKSN
jgi:3-hydroxyisobutyrate dehydrogenase